MTNDDCLLCRKHRGQAAVPPGGYIIEDVHWMVCHAPPDRGPLGTLFIESRRHVLDFADLDPAEAASFGPLAQRLYSALRPLVGAQRIYQVSMMEGIAHFHVWLVPRTPEILERGVAFLARDLSCTEQAASKLAAALRSDLQPA